MAKAVAVAAAMSAVEAAELAAEAAEELPQLSCRVFLGFRGDIKDGVHYISEDEILYAAGAVLVLHNFSERKQRYLRPPPNTKITCMAVTPNKRFLAVGEKSEKHVIAVYELETLKKRRVLSLPPDGKTTEFSRITFTHDSRVLVATSGAPDWLMLYYMWERGKLDSSTRVNTPPNPNRVIQIVPNPLDNTVMCCVGPSLFRLYNMQEGQWKNYGFTKSDPYDLCCADWLGIDRILAGTTDGLLLLLEFAELKAVYRAADLAVVDFRAKELEGPPDLELLQPPPSSAASKGQDVCEAVHHIVNFTRGFVYDCGPGAVYFFEKVSNHKFERKNIFHLEMDLEEDEKGPEGVKFDKSLLLVQTLGVDPAGNNLLVTTKLNQLYTTSLWPEGKEVQRNILVPLGEPIHQGPVVDLAMCSLKQIFVTCGRDDHTVRVWNYQTEHCELTKRYQEDIYSAALHPTGLFVIIGFSDKLRYMQVLIDDLRVIREHSIRCCRKCSFSTNGHLFAAVSTLNIQIFSSISHQVIFVLRGHNGRVTSLRWNSTDSKLISCGVDGAVYEWDMSKGKRQGEIIDKTEQFFDVAVTQDGKTSYAIGSSGTVKEIMESEIVREVKIVPQVLDAILLSRSDQMMFLAKASGALLSVKFPLSLTAEFTEFVMHRSKVTKMALSYDDTVLISTDEEGSVCFWHLQGIEGKGIQLDPDFKFSNDILIPKAELNEKINDIKTLKLRMQELLLEHDYHMRQVEAEHEEKVKEIHDSYNQAIIELTEKNENMEREHTQEINMVNSDIERMKENHEKTIESLEASFNSKLIVEYEKFARLEDQCQCIKSDLRRQLNDLTESKINTIRDLTQNYEEQLHEKNVQLEELQEEACNRVREHEEIKQQIEEDADREILHWKCEYERLLKDERECNVRLRGETAMMKKKFMSSQKEIEEFKHQIHTLQADHQRFKQIIGNLERDIADLKKEIIERDGTIQEKETNIYELKRKNQELEKFKFVLDFKIQELKSQIEPKDREINEKKEQIAEMGNELEGLQKINITLDLQVDELREKLKAQTNISKRKSNEIEKMQTLLHRIRVDLHCAAGLIQEPELLKKAIKHLFTKYSEDPDYFVTQQANMDVQEEFLRQRDFLEKTIKILQKEIRRHTELKKTDTSKLMEDNSELIAEVNALRRELKLANRQIKDMKSILGLKYNFVNPKEAQDRLQAAIQTNEEVHKEYEEKIKKLETINYQLKAEVDRLVAKLDEDEAEGSGPPKAPFGFQEEEDD